MESDELAGLPRRSELLLRHGASKAGVLLVLGIDGLTVVDEMFGRQARNAMVSEVGALLRDACPAAFVASLGGGKFAALFLNEGDEDVAAKVAEFLRAAAEARYAGLRETCRRAGVFSISGAGPVTLSLGIVSVGWYGNVENALAMADRALSHAKVTGGNRVAVGLPSHPGIDALTGLLNRRAFEVAFENARLNTREGFGVIHADLNSFKRINDARGHDFGDAVLVAIAKTLRSHRGVEHAARAGGDEFTAIMPIHAFELDRAAANLWQSLVEAGEKFREQLSDVLAEVRPTYLGPPRPPLGVTLVAIWIPPNARYSQEDVQQVADDMSHAIASLKGTGHMVLRLPR